MSKEPEDAVETEKVEDVFVEDTIIIDYPDGKSDTLTFPAGSIDILEKGAKLAGKSLSEFIVDEILHPYAAKNVAEVADVINDATKVEPKEKVQASGENKSGFDSAETMIASLRNE